MFPAVYADADVDEKRQPANNKPPSPKVNATAPSVYDEILLYEFNAVPLTSTDESEWYGPWNSLLRHLFPPKEGFQIAPQYQRAEVLGGPERTVFFIVKHYGHFIACIVQVKPLSHYQYPKMRLIAYEQLQNRLEECVEDLPSEDVSAIFGLSCFGPRYMIMKLDKETGQVRPSLHILPQVTKASAKSQNTTSVRSQSVAKHAPQKWWSHHVLKKQGSLTIHRFGEEVRKSLKSKHELMVNHPVSIESLPDDDSDSEFSWDEYMED